MGKKKTSRAEWDRLRLVLMDRARDRCEFCGRMFTGAPGMGTEIHHRKLRSQGGADDLDNLVLVHTLCHHRAHHYPEQSYEWGWLVRSHDDPAAVPVKIVRPGTWEKKD